MKKYFGLGVAIVLAFIGLALTRQAPTVTVAVAARNVAAGHMIAEGDIELKELPQALVNPDAVTDPALAVGQTVSVDRAVGDLILASQLGEAVTLQADERGVALTVQDSSGMAGLLKPGDMVGVTAIIFKQGNMDNGAYSKVTIENLRVLYLAPTFKAIDPSQADPAAAADPMTAPLPQERAREGAVVLAVPVSKTVVQYDFSNTDSPSQERTVSALELLTALDAADNATLSLYLMPRDAQPFQTGGLWLPDLVITPGPTPTPTGTLSATLPGGMPTVAAPTATPEPAGNGG